jgi:hypothetical protein
MESTNTITPIRTQSSMSRENAQRIIARDNERMKRKRNSCPTCGCQITNNKINVAQ